MKVVVWVRDQAIEVEVGPGNQRLKWLAMVCVQRYERSGTGHSFACVPAPESRTLPMLPVIAPHGCAAMSPRQHSV